MGALRAVLWDVDGTLANSEPVHRASTLATMDEYGIKASEEDELLGVHRAGVYAFMRDKYAGLPDYDTYSDDVDRHYLQRIGDIKPFVAATTACLAFQRAGLAQVAVSNSGEVIVEATLRAVGMRDVLAGIVTADGKARPKPSPDPYQRGLDMLGVTAPNAIAIEDSSVGVAAARAAGLFVIGVPENGADIGAHLHFSQMPAMLAHGSLFGHD